MCEVGHRAITIRPVNVSLPAVSRYTYTPDASELPPWSELGEVAGDLTMLASVGFVDGGFEYRATTSGDFQGATTLDVFEDDMPVETTGVEAGIDEFSAVFPSGTLDEAMLVLNASDAEGTSFPVPQRLMVIETDISRPQIVLPAIGVEVFLDSTATAIDRLSILGSPFPAPQEGLPDSLVRVSPVYGLEVASTGDFELVFRIYYDADSLLSNAPEGVTMFRWDDGWISLETAVMSDSLVQTATARIDRGGYYAAYLDLRHATQTATDDDGLPKTDGLGVIRNYPNPFTGVTVVPISLDQPSEVGLTVFNVLGQKVATVSEPLLQAGRHELRFDASKLPSGAYVYTVEAVGVKRTGVMLVAR